MGPWGPWHNWDVSLATAAPGTAHRQARGWEGPASWAPGLHSPPRYAEVPQEGQVPRSLAPAPSASLSPLHREAGPGCCHSGGWGAGDNKPVSLSRPCPAPRSLDSCLRAWMLRPTFRRGSPIMTRIGSSLLLRNRRTVLPGPAAPGASAPAQDHRDPVGQWRASLASVRRLRLWGQRAQQGCGAGRAEPSPGSPGSCAGAGGSVSCSRPAISWTQRWLWRSGLVHQPGGPNKGLRSISAQEWGRRRLRGSLHPEPRPAVLGGDRAQAGAQTWRTQAAAGPALQAQPGRQAAVREAEPCGIPGISAPL